MVKGKLLKGCIVGALMLGQAAPATADSDGLVGGIVGGIIGGVIVNEANKNRQRQTVTRRATTQKTYINSAQREANRETQVALNYFGYPVGAPDGVLGRQSRAAISEYQLTLGYPPTGQLTEYERTHLVGSYQRAIAGGAVTMQQAAANPLGLRGLLVTWRDEAAGVAMPQVQQPGQMALMPQTPAPVVEAAAPEAAPAEPGLPTFLGGAAAQQASLASACNKIALMTSTNGGYTTVANMTDASAALGEQFCLARSYAIATGEEMAAQVPGTTPDEIAEQCLGFAPAMKAQAAALSLEPAPGVLAQTRAFALGTGMAPPQLAATAKICLSVGYARDNMDVAVASALLLAGLGEAGYGELLGHHLSQGYGAAKRTDLAFDWYGMAVDAAAKGSTPVFAPGQPERIELVRKAAYAVAGRDDEAAASAVPAALPTFKVPAAPAATTAPAATAN
ncbi:MAG: peptidoglycan-binding protein [Proteobacteria bacterium]|nr:peptidoglycan-binding protein [Pseudomonadota bacterium]